MQYTNQVATSTASCFDPQQQLQHISSVSPITAPVSVDHSQGHGMIPMSPHQQQQAPHPIGNVLSPSQCNQQTSHIQQQASQQQQKSQLLPLLLSPRPPSIRSTSADHNVAQQNDDTDHDQIVEQVISLENDFNGDASNNTTNVDDNLGLMLGHQTHRTPQQQPQLSDNNSNVAPFLLETNQFSSSSEDLLNLLLEFDKEPSQMMCLSGQQMDQDDKVGIETIRKQLMSCEMQSEQVQNHNTNSMSPTILNQMNCQPQISQQVATQQQPLSQTAPVISHHQQPQHQVSGLARQQQQQIPHQRLSVDQSLLHGPYSHLPVGTVPISSSSQSYTNQQQQHVAGLSQSNPMSIVNNSPSPSWQQPQLSPYSPQTSTSNQSRVLTQRQSHPSMQHQQQQSSRSHQMQQHAPNTSPQLQQTQLHHSMPQRSPSQSVSPPATTEPSPVVKKNPLLNAQLVNSRAPSITQARFLGSPTNVLTQNPILNAKLSQGPFIANNGGTIGSPVNPSLTPQPRYIQQQSSFDYDIAQQPQQQNAQQHTPPQTGHMSLYRPGDQPLQQQQQQQPQPPQQQQTTTTTAGQTFRTTNVASAGIGRGSPMNMGSTSPVGALSQQVKQEIRRKVQQPKQHQTTSLLKQLLSDNDNK